MKSNKPYYAIGIAVIFAVIGNVSRVQAQNAYPTTKGSNLKIDGGAIDFAAPATTGGWARGISFYNPDMSSRYLGLGLHGSANQATRFYLAFDSPAPWNSTVGLQILANGNVGIGTITPVARLTVNGNILAKEIKIKTDISVPDYVFDPEYKLPTLASIEDYVKKHRHLPEIPSAATVQKEGVNLTEMNFALLKKIEELTLHLIEKDKEITLIKNELSNLKKQVHESN
ncbi:hypothetical protein [Sphingobacterium thalpophilum]|uniref:hypothetical protein n=1 Tax=Sphingobacterium thalpophilum TaxID=259 RepID=UPI0031D8AAF5